MGIFRTISYVPFSPFPEMTMGIFRTISYVPFSPFAMAASQFFSGYAPPANTKDIVRKNRVNTDETRFSPWMNTAAHR